MGVTIYDIAKSASVSIATVSRVLNGHDNVSAATRSRVRAAARELGYQPNPSARNLAQKKVNVISAVVPMMTTHFFMEVLRGVQDRIAETDYDLLIFSSANVPQVDNQITRAIHRGRSGGVLLFSTPISSDRLEVLSDADIPVVLVDSEHPEFDSVSTDSERGGYLATRHLIEHGHRRIGLIMGHPESVPAVNRKNGYSRALREAGIDVEPNLIVHTDDNRMHGFTEKDGYQLMDRLLSENTNLDAVFATSDIQALGAMSAAKSRGVSIPDELAIVGFDDILISGYLGLTTIRQPMFDMGRQAADRLLDRMSELNSAPTHTVFVPQLVERDSTLSRSRVASA